MTLPRSTPLRRTGPPERRTRLSHGRGSTIPTDVRLAVRKRSGGRCELATPVCAAHAQELHHRLPRGRGGRDDSETLADTCRPCHRYAHEHPAEAHEAGWLIRTGAGS